MLPCLCRNSIILILVSIAHIARAILLAKAIATSIRGFRDGIRASHESSGMDLRPIQFSRDIE